MRARAEPTYFLDEDVDGPDLAERLRAAGLDCRRHGDEVARGTPDTEWIPRVAALGWWAVTRDLRMRKRAAEIDAIRAAGAVHIVLRGGPASALIAAHPRLSAHLARRYPPMIAHVHPGGRFEMVVDDERRSARRRH